MYVPFAKRLLLFLSLLCAAVPAWGHPAPYSYLDLSLSEGDAEGRLTIHSIDAAHELSVADPETLEASLTPAHRRALERLLADRLDLSGAEIRWTGITPLPDNDALRLTFGIEALPADALRVSAELFPYDPAHQTFVNIYEDGSLRRQEVLASGSPPLTYYRGTGAGLGALVGTYVESGIHHILIGPDHLLFLLGLLLMGGGWRRLVAIVTAFTLGHSITLALAALNLVTPPAALVEPLIALSIVVVGADTLLQRKQQGRDVRAWMAGAFGLVHGFGFANVLRDFGLPQEALGWSLVSFNVGVELGQLAVVLALAALLAAIGRWSVEWRQRVTLAGAVVVIGAGVYWFAERTVLGGVI